MFLIIIIEIIIDYPITIIAYFIGYVIYIILKYIHFLPEKEQIPKKKREID